MRAALDIAEAATGQGQACRRCMLSRCRLKMLRWRCGRRCGRAGALQGTLRRAMQG